MKDETLGETDAESPQLSLPHGRRECAENKTDQDAKEPGVPSSGDELPQLPVPQHPPLSNGTHI